MSECHRIKGIVMSEDFKRGYRILVRLSCKMWGCPYCGPRNASAWRAYLLDRFNQYLKSEKWCFCTITAHKLAHKNARTSLKNLQQVWKRLYDRLRRRYSNTNLQYVRVFETHKSGRFHMHFLLNIGVDYDSREFVVRNDLDEYRHPDCRWLRVCCAELGGGWRVHIRRVWERGTRTASVGLVIGYIVKYLGKQLVEMELPKYQRRIQTSRKIGSPATNAKGQGTWRHMRELPLSTLASSALPIIDWSTGEILSKDSFEGEGYYPPIRYYKGEQNTNE